MSYGIVRNGTVGSHKASLNNTLGSVARMEKQREDTYNMAKAGMKKDQKNSIMSGVGAGASMGFMMGGPIGGVIGAGIGGLAGGLMDSIF